MVRISPQLIVGLAAIGLAFVAGWKFNGDRWESRYTKLQLAVAEARAAGEAAGRAALEAAHKRDRDALQALLEAANKALKEAQDDRDKIQAEADRLAGQFANDQRDPDCGAWADTAIACPVRLLSTTGEAGAGGDRGARAGPVPAHTRRTDCPLPGPAGCPEDKRRPVPAVVSIAAGGG